MKLSNVIQKILYYDDRKPKEFNLFQFFFALVIFVVVVFYLNSVLFSKCVTSSFSAMEILNLLWGILLSLHLSYYQASNITWDKGFHVYVIAGPVQLCSYLVLFLLPSALIGC